MPRLLGISGIKPLQRARKPFWLTEYQEDEVAYGYPVFEYAKSLSGRRFIPKEEYLKKLNNDKSQK